MSAGKGTLPTDAEHRADRILAQMSDALVVVDGDFRVIDVNPAAERVLGTRRDALVGRSHWDAFPGSVGEEPERQYRRVQAEGTEAHFTHHYVDAGRDFHAEIDAYRTDDGGVAIFWRDVTSRVESEERLRAAAARDAFRIALADRLWPLADPAAIQAAAACVLGEHLGASRVHYGEIAEDAYVVVEHDYTDGVRNLRGRFPMASFGPALIDTLRAGRALVMPDVARSDALSDAERTAYASVDVGAQVGVPLVVSGRLVAVLSVHQAVPRSWTPSEIALIHETAERTWYAVARARAEAALRAGEARYRTLFDAVDESVCVIEVIFSDDNGSEAPRPVDYRFLETNPAFVAQTGLGDAIGRTIRELSPTHETHWFEIYGRVALTGAPTRFEAPAEALGRWYDVYAVRVGAPEERRVAVFFKDIMPRKRAEEEREQLMAKTERSADRLARLHRVSTALATPVTPEALAAAVVREGTPAVGASVGLVTRLSEDGSEFRILAAHGLPDEAAAAWTRFPNQSPSPHADTLATRTPLFVQTAAEYEQRFPHLSGLRKSARAAATAALPLVVAGESFGVLSFGFAESRTFTAEDREFLVTIANQCAQALERARLIGAEQAARRAAEAANRAKSDFLAVMSHELRTPLNAIGGYAELVELGIYGPVTPEQRTALERIQRSQRALLSMINEVLNYARLESGAVTFDVTDVGVFDAVGAAEVLVAPQLRAKGLAYAWAGGDPGLTVRADRDKLQQILLNLLSNAVKFTDSRDGQPGCVEVSCAADPVARHVMIHVRDTGMGIPRDKLGAIFEPFVQVDTVLTRSQQGTGLGLAISRDLARGMGGELTVESTPGVGSTFTLKLPRA